MFLVGKNDIGDLCPGDIDGIKYAPVPNDAEWRIDILNELIDVKYGNSSIGILNKEEIDDIIELVCSS